MQPQPKKILRLEATCERTGLAKSTIYARIKQGGFVSPLRLGPRSIGFLESEVNTWIESRERGVHQTPPKLNLAQVKRSRDKTPAAA